MLSQLSIKNFGLIDDVSLDFSNQLNILTGETGAGKSIVIGALRYVLGERLHNDQIRDSNKTCAVEAVFDLDLNIFRNNPTFEEFLEEDDSLIIQRSCTAEGRNRIKVNGITVTVSQLKEIGNHLIDLHGPHDHQMLLAEKNHIHIIDNLTDFKNIFTDYALKYREYAEITKKISDLRKMAQSRDHDLDLLKHQIQELGQISLTEEAYAINDQEHTKINNSQKLYEYINMLVAIFENEKSGIETSLQNAFRPMRDLTAIDDKASALFEQLNNLQSSSSELYADLRNYADSLQFDEQYAQEVSEQYSAYQNLLRKYGPTITDVSKFYDNAKLKYSALDDFEHSDAELKKKLSEIQNILLASAKKITQKRKATAKDLKETIESELKELGFSHVQFEARIEKVEFNNSGADHICFYISPNAGEELKPLANIVSSGESARIMLALKKALIDVDPIPVLIFDEIDAQIGGRLGSITGKKLKEIASKRQVVLITHLPQIASYAQTHFKITKPVKNGRACTEVSLLDEATRIQELAEMMAGHKETDIALTHAQDMLTNAQKSG